MGVEYRYETKKVIFLGEPQSIEDRLNYLLALKGIRVDNPKEFAIFYYCLINFEEYQYCPWETRTKLLRENYGLTTDHRKLQNWCKMLIERGLLSKSGKSDARVWTTFYRDYKKCQEPIDENDKEAIAAKDRYWERFWELTKFYTDNPAAITDTDKRGKPLKPSGQANKDCWREFGCCYYSCQNFIECAWSKDEEEQAIKDIINTYVESIM